MRILEQGTQIEVAPGPLFVIYTSHEFDGQMELAYSPKQSRRALAAAMRLQEWCDMSDAEVDAGGAAFDEAVDQLYMKDEWKAVAIRELDPVTRRLL